MLLSLGMSAIFTGFEGLRWLSLAVLVLAALWIGSPIARRVRRLFEISRAWLRC